MSRWKAGAIHLGISAVVIALAALVLFGWWFPLPYAGASGADTLILLLLGVDLALGPLLTTIVYKPGKPSLRFDLTTIALLQAGALAYGLWIASEARLVFLVSTEDRITLVPANLIVPESLAKASYPQFASLSWTGPRLAAANPPLDAEGSFAMLQSAMAGRDVEAYPEHYVPYAEHRFQLLMRGKPVAKFADREGGAEALADLQRRFPETWEQHKFLPLMGRRYNLSVVLDPETAEPVASYRVSPW